MANVRFNLKRKSGNEKQLILLIFRFNGNRLVYSTGQTIPIKYWDNKKMRAKQVRQYPFQSLNNYLNKLEYEVLNKYREYLVEGELPTSEQLKNHLDKLNNKNKLVKNQLIGYIDKVIEERKILPKYRSNTIKKYISVRNQLAEYEKEYKTTLSFKKINLDFFYKFTAYLYGRGQSSNSVKKSITTLKVFLNDATERGGNTYTFYKSKKFSVKEEKTESTYLTIPEIEKLYYFKFDTERLEKVKDAFILSCCTGLRYSDLVHIAKKHIRQIGKIYILDMLTVKTKKRVLIPLHPFVFAILNKYDFALPTISNQKMNKYLKELCQLAGLTNTIYLTKNEGGKQISKAFEKWEVISSHTGRRSFITNLRSKGESDSRIMKMTGHTNVKQLSEYDKATLEENALKMASTNFFSVKMKVV